MHTLQKETVSYKYIILYMKSNLFWRLLNPKMTNIFFLLLHYIIILEFLIYTLIDWSCIMVLNVPNYLLFSHLIKYIG